MQWLQRVRMGLAWTGVSTRKWPGAVCRAGTSLQGNFDPAKLLSPIPVIEKEVKKCCGHFGPGRYIAILVMVFCPMFRLITQSICRYCEEFCFIRPGPGFANTVKLRCVALFVLHTTMHQRKTLDDKQEISRLTDHG